MPTNSFSTIRIEAFSDGVFAIAITLLVLEIKVLSDGDLQAAGGLWVALTLRWHSYVGYVTSFVLIGVMWANHHALFEYIRRVDRWLLLANLFLMMCIGFVPYPTAILAEHLGDPATRTAATAFYGATLVICSIAYNMLWWSGRWQRRLLGSDVHEQGLQTITRRYAFAMVSYVVATGLAFINVWLSLAVHLGLALWNACSERTEQPVVRH